MFDFIIDYPKTRKAVEFFMWNYENMKFKLEESKLFNISESFIMSNPNKNNTKNSPVENSVIYFVEVEEELMALLSTIEKSFNRLSLEEWQYIGMKYFNDKKLNDEEIRDKMLCGYRWFTELKRKSITRFALSLGIEARIVTSLDEVKKNEDLRWSDDYKDIKRL